MVIHGDIGMQDGMHNGIQKPAPSRMRPFLRGESIGINLGGQLHDLLTNTLTIRLVGHGAETFVQVIPGISFTRIAVTSEPAMLSR